MFVPILHRQKLSLKQGTKSQAVIYCWIWDSLPVLFPHLSITAAETYIHIYTYLHAYIYTFVGASIHTHTHTHTHTQHPSSLFSQILFEVALGRLQCPREQTRADVRLSSGGNTLPAFSTRGLRQFLWFPLWCVNPSLVAQRIKPLPAMRETRVWSLGWEDPLEKEMATHSSILAWRIPWMEEPGGLQSMGSQRVWLHFHFTLWCVTLPEIPGNPSWTMPPPYPSHETGVMPTIPGLHFGNHLLGTRCSTETSPAHLEFWLLKKPCLGISTCTLSFLSPAWGQSPGWKWQQVKMAMHIPVRAGTVNSLEPEARREEGRHDPCSSH